MDHLVIGSAGLSQGFSQSFEGQPGVGRRGAESQLRAREDQLAGAGRLWRYQARDRFAGYAAVAGGPLRLDKVEGRFRKRQPR